MGLTGRLLVGGCLVYQALTLILIFLVVAYFWIIGPQQVLAEIHSNVALVVTVAVPTTLFGIISFGFCYYIDVNY